MNLLNGEVNCWWMSKWDQVGFCLRQYFPFVLLVSCTFVRPVRCTFLQLVSCTSLHKFVQVGFCLCQQLPQPSLLWHCWKKVDKTARLIIRLFFAFLFDIFDIFWYFDIFEGNLIFLRANPSSLALSRTKFTSNLRETSSKRVRMNEWILNLKYFQITSDVTEIWKYFQTTSDH